MSKPILLAGLVGLVLSPVSAHARTCEQIAAKCASMAGGTTAVCYGDALAHCKKTGAYISPYSGRVFAADAPPPSDARPSSQAVLSKTNAGKQEAEQIAALLTTFYSQTVTTPATLANPTDVWTVVAALAKANQIVLNSSPGQVLTNTLAAAGSTLDVSPVSVGDVQDIVTATLDIQRGDYLGAAQVGADELAVGASATLGMALMPEAPAVGRAAGAAGAQFIIQTWKEYEAPAVGDLLVQLLPNTFIPAAAN